MREEQMTEVDKQIKLHNKRYYSMQAFKFWKED